MQELLTCLWLVCLEEPAGVGGRWHRAMGCLPACALSLKGTWSPCSGGTVAASRPLAAQSKLMQLFFTEERKPEAKIQREVRGRQKEHKQQLQPGALIKCSALEIPYRFSVLGF